MLHLDFETRSEAELGGKNSVGLHNYSINPTTRVLMLAWAFGEDEPQLWVPSAAMPERLLKGLQNPEQDLAAFNSSFERYILQYQLGITIPASRFHDPQASARMLSLPANLEDVGMVLGLPNELRKDKRGEELLDLFSYPKTRSKKELKQNPNLSAVYFNNELSHPEEWALLGEYCLQDIRAEREIARRLSLLGVYPLPGRERKIWILDQKINDRGFPVDRKFVQLAYSIASRNKEEKIQQQKDATGLENPNSQAQLLPWVRERGYPLTNLRRQNVELTLKNPAVVMTEEARNVLEARIEASSTSYVKLAAILRNLSPDDTVKNMFVYAGSSRCGRWGGAGVQPHNFARPDSTFEDMDNVNKARAMIYVNDYDGLTSTFLKDPKKLRVGEEPRYSPLLIVRNLIRTVFVAPEGFRYNVSDLAAIETRVGAWVAECKPLLEVFEKGLDPYIAFAVKLTGIPYEKLYYDLKKNPDKAAKAWAKLQRQFAKPGVLGAIYRLGPGKFSTDKNGDITKTGLFGYAEAMGIDITQEESDKIVKVFRESYPEICGPPRSWDEFPGGIWYRLENAVADVLKGSQTVRYVGPDNCIKIDKLTFGNAENTRVILRIHLPGGRILHYMDASLESVKMPWTKTVKDEDGNEIEEEVRKMGFCYYGKNQTTGAWSLIVSHGGKVYENIVQGLSRDILSEGMLRVDRANMDICAHVHDEIVALTPDDPFASGAHEMEKLMSDEISWVSTLPLGAEGWEDFFYHK